MNGCPEQDGFAVKNLTVTMLPLLAIIQITYQPDHVRTIIKNVPRSLGSLLIYAMIVAASYKSLGVVWGTLLGYLAATLYLVALEYGLKRYWVDRSKT